MATMAIDRRTNPISIDISDTDAWHAVENRDASFDGRFVFAVRTTGIYCRPSCAARRPLRANVSFFSAPDEAERAGFRACLRCDPRSERAETSVTAAVERARSYLDSHEDRVVPLRELATHAGISASHLQRSFKQLLGVSPREYQHARRVGRFKLRLRAGDTVSRATYEAGFGSSSRVYERADAVLGMTPASYRRGGAGMRIVYTIADAPIGRVLVATTDRGVCAVALGETDAEVERALRADFPNATIERSDDTHGAWVQSVLDHIREPARPGADRIPLDVDGTAFQWQVWKALQAIPVGERRTYRQIATEIGRPSAARAVARACATNRVAVVIPCHRVVREGGKLSGYKWGVERKRRLLDSESA
jgi:AraC family transcriptional regulator, regulatory protein of adaptative response / methylated-DNA-[protein]-cysteine methyltransferase